MDVSSPILLNTNQCYDEFHRVRNAVKKAQYCNKILKVII